MLTKTRRPLGRLLPNVIIPPPGPKSIRLAAKLAQHESPGVSGTGPPPIVWREAHGANVADADGNIYIDLTAGFAVANVGHANQRVVTAIRRQAGRLLHGFGDVHPNGPRVELAQRLTTIAPIRESKAIFCNSGSEAVEAALKTATLYTRRHHFIAFDRGFHGQTYGALAVTARDEFRAPFAPQLNPHVTRVPYANCYRCPVGQSYPACDIACLKPVEQALADASGSAHPVAAVIVEPIQGREGEVVPPPEYFPKLKELCQHAGALLIADEMMTGFGRTGRWFAMQHWNVQPDIICLGKAMAGGMPMAACIAPAEIMDAWRHARPEAPQSSTFMGHPVGCAAALATIDEIERRRLPERAETLG